MTLPSSLLDHMPWENEVNPIWPAASFTLRRNLGNFHFPSKEDAAQSLQTLEIIKNALLKSPELQAGQFLKAEELSAVDKEFLIEHFLRGDSFQNSFAGQGFMVDPASHFLATINIQDHLQLQLVDCAGKWEESWNLLSKIDTAIGSAGPFAFSPVFGYLTADTGNCGTGLTVDVLLHLPALIHTGKLEETLLKQMDPSVTAFGMEGKLENVVGDLLILRNRYTLGMSEESILFALNTSAMKLIVAEKIVRNELQKENSLAMRDLISRAYGLLIHSFQLQTKETLDALSLIKLGIDLGWITGATDKKINAIFFKCRRAHLLHHLKSAMTDAQEIAKQRALFLHEQLAELKLT